MVGAAREELAAAPSGNVVVVPTCAAILPRRILFHPPLKAPLPSSSSSLALTPLNLPPPSVSPASTSGVLEDTSSHRTSAHATVPLPTIRIQRIGAGLNNLGNTCFLNAVLQCLTYTPPLAAYFQAGLHQSSCRSVGFCAMCALERHVKQVLSAQGRVISPNLLVKNLRCISRSFQMGRQEDAHEYMRYLIEALQKSCPLEANANTLSSSYRNFIQRIFGGRLRSQVKCTQCSQSSNTYDPFLDLSLDIVKAESLLKALARFTAIEILDGDNKYYCCKCKSKVRAHKQFTIDHAPHVLTVQFKRFSSCGGYGGKIDKRVQFDRSFNLKPFVNGGKEGCLRYSLYAVLVHSGWSTHSGHYFCFVRTSADIWYKLDDNRVSQVSEKVVLEQKAYILFYARDMEILPACVKNDCGTRSEKILLSNGTCDAAKRQANGLSSHKDTAQLKGSLCNGIKTENHVARSSLNIAINDMHNLHVVQNNVEVLANGSTIRTPARCTTKACIPATVRGIEKDCFAGVEASGAFSSLNDQVGNSTVDVLTNGKVQMNVDTNQLSPRAQAKACMLAPAEKKLYLSNGNGEVHVNGDANMLSPRTQAKACTSASAETNFHLPNGAQVGETKRPTDQKIRRNEISHHEIYGNGSVKHIKNEVSHHEINGNGSVKHVRLTNLKKTDAEAGKETDVKADKLRKPEGQAALSVREKAMFTLPLSQSTSFEMAVPRWEEDAKESKGDIAEEQNLMAETAAHCGYVLDEWDEEYDRGKRKKMRRKEGGKHEISELSEPLQIYKKRKEVSSLPIENNHTVAPISNGDCHGNPFAGKKAQPELDAAQLKKSRKRQRGSWHNLFLKRYRFKQLHTKSQRRRKR